MFSEVFNGFSWIGVYGEEVYEWCLRIVFFLSGFEIEDYVFSVFFIYVVCDVFMSLM